MIGWVRALETRRARQERAVAVTVAAVRGSTPREAGAKMIVDASTIDGTIGGGNLEFKAIGIARAMLAAGSVPHGTAAMHRFPLGASLGQCCGGIANLLFETFEPREAGWLAAVVAAQEGGEACVIVTPMKGAAATGKRVLLGVDASAAPSSGHGGPAQRVPDDAVPLSIARALLAGGRDTARVVDVAPPGAMPNPLLFEAVRPAELRIVLFGAGHVGRALAGVLATLDCELTWVDDRDAAFPAGVPGHVALERGDTGERVIERAAPGSCFLVMTHSHSLDFALAERILARGDFRYFGLIGSATKRRRFEQRLAERGVARAALARMTCPIGIDGIDSKEPAAIAVAVAAELLQLRRHGAAGAESPPADVAAAAPRRIA
ncbi:MAG TPA: xanthine dehydrogenase accessory protein XdhC [Burkholderiaceae bacterium]|nr:xanthine dehydrogenase accessory protein XdhC [Burkholderiaceae bacterium]